MYRPRNRAAAAAAQVIIILIYFMVRVQYLPNMYIYIPKYLTQVYT